MNSAEPRCYGLVKDLDRCISVAKRQRGKPPEPVRVCSLCAGELVVQKPCERDLLVVANTVEREAGGARDDNVDAGLRECCELMVEVPVEAVERQ